MFSFQNVPKLTNQNKYHKASKLPNMAHDCLDMHQSAAKEWIGHLGYGMGLCLV